MDYFFLTQEDKSHGANPMIVMVDESTGEKYARASGKKGTGSNGDLDWLIQDMFDELKARGDTGGASGHIILKSGNEPALRALRDAVGRLLGGRVIPENPPKGESQANPKKKE